MVNAKSKIFPLALLMLSAVGILAAQGTKAKPKPLATPPVLTGAEIVSRADDYVSVPVPQTSQAEKRADATASESEIVKELTERIKKLEASQKVDKDEKQKRLLLNLDILTRAEQRTESLRKQMFEMIEKENAIKARLDQLDIDMRPDVIERALQLNGSMRPEEVRESRRKTLNAEKANLQSLLTEIQNTRSNLSLNLQKAEAVVEKLRAKLEKDIDDSLVEDTDK
jgi:hypothetical protein